MGMTDLVFGCNKIFGSGRILIFFLTAWIKKCLEPKKVVNKKNQFFHARQPREGIFDICLHTGVVFSHFLARASNGRQYSNFENKCPKLCTGTPDDMVLTNLGDSFDSDSSGFVLMHITHIVFTGSHYKKKLTFHYRISVFEGSFSYNAFCISGHMFCDVEALVKYPAKLSGY